MRSTAFILAYAAALAISPARAQDGDAFPGERQLVELLEKLGSDDPSVRERASQELTRLGQKLVDTLRRVAKTSGDPEIRARAMAALDALKQDPTFTREKLRSLSVDIAMEQGATLSDLLGSISQKTGVRFLLHFDESVHIGELDDIAFRGVSLEAVLDSICRDKDLQWGIDAEQRVFLMLRPAFFDRFAETKVLDVSDLVDPARDHSPDRSNPSAMSEEELVHLLQLSIEPSSWEPDNVWMKVDGGLLRVRHLPDVVQRVERMIGELRAKLARPVKVELLGILCDPAKLRAWIGPDLRDPTPEQMQALLAKVAAEEEVKRFAWLQLSATNGRWGRGVHSHESTLVVGFHVEKAGERSLVLPVTRAVSEGIEAFMRPRVSEDGRRATVELEIEATRLVEIDSVKTDAGEIRLPKVMSLEFKQTADLAHDRWGIVGMAAPAGKPELRLLLLARVEIAR